VRELDSAEARQGRALLLAFGDIGGWMKALRETPSGPSLDWSAEMAREWDRKYQWPEDRRNPLRDNNFRLEKGGGYAS
jgi:hypothetical protein